jgi:hypothetical protein
MPACLIPTMLLPILMAAESLLSRRPSLTLLLLSACLFALAALLQRLTSNLPPTLPSARMVRGETKETSL